MICSPGGLPEFRNTHRAAGLACLSFAAVAGSRRTLGVQVFWHTRSTRRYGRAPKLAEQMYTSIFTTLRKSRAAAQLPLEMVPTTPCTRTRKNHCPTALGRPRAATRLDPLASTCRCRPRGMPIEMRWLVFRKTREGPCGLSIPKSWLWKVCDSQRACDHRSEKCRDNPAVIVWKKTVTGPCALYRFHNNSALL